MTSNLTSKDATLSAGQTSRQEETHQLEQQQKKPLQTTSGRSQGNDQENAIMPAGTSMQVACESSVTLSRGKFIIAWDDGSNASNMRSARTR